MAEAHGIHDGQVRYDAVRTGYSRGTARRRHRIEHAVAAHAGGHRRGEEPARRRRGDGPGAQAGDLLRRGLRDPQQALPRIHRQHRALRGRAAGLRCQRLVDLQLRTGRETRRRLLGGRRQPAGVLRPLGRDRKRGEAGRSGSGRAIVMAGAATPALAALIDAGVPHEVVKFDHDPRERSFGGEAVRALTTVGAVDPDQIYKTLIIAVPDGLAVAILPALARLSLRAAAAALGVGKAAMADQRAAERATGYVLGAVSPFGQRTRLPTVVDSGALVWERMYVSAGRRGWDVAVAPGDLITLTDAVTAELRA